MPFASGDLALPRRPQIASLTKYIPFIGIPHAGGQYLAQHYRALSDQYQIDAFAPSTPENRAALERRSSALNKAELIAGNGLFRHGRLKLMADIDSVIRGSSATRNIENELRSSAALRAELARADVIEFQWSEMASLAPIVRRMLPDAKLVFIAHDVITQRWQRRGQESQNPAVKSAYFAAANLSRSRERLTLETVDQVILFSEKDAAIAAAIAPTANLSVVPPGLTDTDGLPERRPQGLGGPTVLFTGAMNRADNHEAVLWFLENAWPTVTREVADARLIIAGAEPPPQLVDRVERSTNVELTGYVDSLEPYYAVADVFIAPIFTGAGVKFKTIDAMLRGVPIVTTSVGAEGLGSDDLYAAVTSRPDAFADAVVGQLRRPDVDRAKRAQAWASERFGFSSFRSRLNAIYQELRHDRG